MINNIKKGDRVAISEHAIASMVSPNTIRSRLAEMKGVVESARNGYVVVSYSLPISIQVPAYLVKPAREND